jgi:hypothetical protein
MSEIASSIGSELQGFGGHLECTVCGHKAPLGNVGRRLSVGWPKCCGYTMRWWTNRELATREGRDDG